MSKRNFSTASLTSAETRRLLRERSGHKNVVLAGRGASAIWAILRALDLHDHPVLIPANTCYIVLWAILQSGNQPYLVDIDPLTGNVTPETLDRCPVVNPAVIIPAHMYGIPAYVPALVNWAKARNVYVIEDAALTTPEATSHLSDAAVLSFGSGKIVDAGGGGALLIDDTALATEAERLLGKLPFWKAPLQRLNEQWLEIYWALHQFEAENPRLPELYPTLYSSYGEITLASLPSAHWRAVNAALTALDETLVHRAEIARLYDERLSVIGSLPRPPNTILWRYPLLVPAHLRSEILAELWSAQIFEATRWYPSLQPMRRALAPDLPATPTPAADHFAGEIINLPLSPDTERAQAERAAEIVLSYFDAWTT
jgi:dTDP-4-amino-4,6-dideoxygalactose transaminase